MAESLERGIEGSEHVLQSLVYHLRTTELKQYDSVGDYTTKRLNVVVPGIIIRPPKTTYSGFPEIDLKENEANSPYLIVFRRPVGPAVGHMYGGGYSLPSMWEINVRLGEDSLFVYMKVSDWIGGFLRKHDSLPIYFYTYTPGSAPVQGDEIGTMRIGDVTVEERPSYQIEGAGGDDGGVVANFTIEIFYAPEEA